MTLKDLAEAISAHDLTFEFSDDPGVYRRGRASLAMIDRLRVTSGVGPAVFAALWNDKVLRYTTWEYAGMFLKGEVRKEHQRQLEALS